jgi:hypothetical protein
MFISFGASRWQWVLLLGHRVPRRSRDADAMVAGDMLAVLRTLVRAADRRRL